MWDVFTFFGIIENPNGKGGQKTLKLFTKNNEKNIINFLMS